MDKLLIAQKLESLRRCIERIDSKCPPSADALGNDIDAQDIVVLNLSRAVQFCVDIASHVVAQTQRPAPATMGDAIEELHVLGAIDEDTAIRLRKAVGFRNIATHNYEAMNWAIVYSICTAGLKDFKTFAKQVATYSGL
jgi:uncharacterized protein YutE (UPF0331/DUF86 family)